MSRRGSKPSRCGNKKQKIITHWPRRCPFSVLSLLTRQIAGLRTEKERDPSWVWFSHGFLKSPHDSRLNAVPPSPTTARHSVECRRSREFFSRLVVWWTHGLVGVSGMSTRGRGRGGHGLQVCLQDLPRGEPFTSGYQAPFLTHPLRGSGRRRWPTSLPSRHPVPVPAGAENRRQQMDVTHGAGSLQNLAPTSARKTTAHELNLAPETASPWRLATDWVTTGNYMHITQASYLVLSSHQIIYVVTPHVTLWCPSKNKYKLSVWWGLPSPKHPYLMKAFLDALRKSLLVTRLCHFTQF